MNILLDTGPWIALIDRSETRHNECRQWLENYKGDIYSTAINPIELDPLRNRRHDLMNSRYQMPNPFHTPQPTQGIPL